MLLTVGEALGLVSTLKGTVLTSNVGVHKITVLLQPDAFGLHLVHVQNIFINQLLSAVKVNISVML
jgi:hypothetical protein